MKTLKPFHLAQHQELLAHYLITPDGKVLSKRDPGREMVQHVRSNGCVTVDLSIPGQGRYRAYVHVLVALCYIEHVPGKFATAVLHKDGNRRNNTMQNLAWFEPKADHVCPVCHQLMSQSPRFNPLINAMEKPA